MSEVGNKMDGKCLSLYFLTGASLHSPIAIQEADCSLLFWRKMLGKSIY
jgi:hypothetical protein